MESSLRLMRPCRTAAIIRPRDTGGTLKTKTREVGLQERNETAEIKLKIKWKMDRESGNLDQLWSELSRF